MGASSPNTKIYSVFNNNKDKTQTFSFTHSFFFIRSQNNITLFMFCVFLLLPLKQVHIQQGKPCSNVCTTLLNNLHAFQLTFTPPFQIKLHRLQSKKPYLAVVSQHKVKFQKSNNKALFEECCQ